MRSAVLAAALLVAGCASWQPAGVYVVEIKDAAALNRDFDVCTDHARNYHPGFDYRSVGIGAASGAMSVLPGLAINPLVVALGAGQGAGVATINGLQLLPATQQRLLAKCLAIKGTASGAYMVLDPNG